MLLSFGDDYYIKEKCIESRNIDYTIAQSLRSAIDDYKKTTDIQVSKIVYGYDSSYIPYYYYNNFGNGDLTLRIVGNAHCIKEFFHVKVGSNLDIKLDQELISSIFQDNNWLEFSPEQIKIVGDTVYYCIF